MPTGYTEAVKDGISFEQFAMRCARAMGACIDMRDAPMDAPIPERFEPSDYCATALAKSQAEFDRLMSMTAQEIAAAAEADYQRQCEQHAERIAEKMALEDKYRTMLESVKCWAPPTDGHAPFKKFMIEQLSMSMDSDCSTEYDVKPVRASPTDWLGTAVAELRRTIAYREKAYREEVDRTEQRNQWLAALRASLVAA